MLPAAIVVAGAMIGGGLYLGLRARPAGTATPPPVEVAGRSGRGPAGARPGEPPADPLAVRRRGQAAVDEFRRQMVERCWRPALAQRAEPGASRYTLEALFSADGTETARGIGEERDGPSRSDVAQCMRLQPLGLRIPPPGGPVRMQFVLEFP
jgi:hypothetical protein